MKIIHYKCDECGEEIGTKGQYFITVRGQVYWDYPNAERSVGTVDAEFCSITCLIKNLKKHKP